LTAVLPEPSVKEVIVEVVLPEKKIEDTLLGKDLVTERMREMFGGANGDP
jgi:hypothetical protein